MNDIDHYEAEDDGDTGMGFLILGAFVLFVWGFGAGFGTFWLFFHK